MCVPLLYCNSTEVGVYGVVSRNSYMVRPSRQRIHQVQRLKTMKKAWCCCLHHCIYRSMPNANYFDALNNSRLAGRAEQLPP